MKIINKASLILLLSLNIPCHSGDFLKQFVKTDTTQKFFVGVIEEKQKALEETKKEQEELTTLINTINEKVVRQMDEVKTLLANIESELHKNPDDDFLIKQQLILKESEQVLKDTQRTLEDNNALMTEIIAQLESFIEDPQFETFKKKEQTERTALLFL